MAPAAPPATSAPASPWLRLLPAGLLALTLLGILVRDLVVPNSNADLGPEPVLAPPEIDKEPRVALGYQHEGFQFGLSMVKETDKAGKPKKLTFHKDGITNFAAVRIDGKAYTPGQWFLVHGSGEKGQAIQRTDDVSVPFPGSLLEKGVKLPKDDSGQHEGERSTWLWDRHQITLSQTVEIVTGQVDPATGKIPLDTCRVTFILTNKGSQKHRVGLRFLLDTFIGERDDVPFYVPRQDNPLVDTMEDFKGEKIPDYIQALETGKLSEPGTVARVSLKIGEGREPPGQVLLTHHIRMMPFDSRDDKEVQVVYEIPLVSIKGDPSKEEVDQRKPDSAVALIWEDKELAPGEERRMGFSYGLGHLASGGGKLAVTGPTNPHVGESFPLMALVTDPIAGQTVEVGLQRGLHLVVGPARQQLPAVARGANSSVTWRIKADKAGTYRMKVGTSTGEPPQEVIVVVTDPGMFK
jgi:hypothetical protein